MNPIRVSVDISERVAWTLAALILGVVLGLVVLGVYKYHESALAMIENRVDKGEDPMEVSCAIGYARGDDCEKYMYLNMKKAMTK